MRKGNVAAFDTGAGPSDCSYSATTPARAAQAPSKTANATREIRDMKFIPYGVRGLASLRYQQTCLWPEAYHGNGISYERYRHVTLLLETNPSIPHFTLRPGSGIIAQRHHPVICKGQTHDF
ncbi:MAG: hypothetical protein AMXMBFR82_16920 [Candidatus Hydrogenedentota bacterium]